MLDSNKFQVNVVDAESESAFYHACKRGNTRLARLLLEYGADPLQKESSNGWSPLMIAIIGGYRGIGEGTVSKSHKGWSMEDARGWLPVEHAIYRGHLWIRDVAPPFNPADSSREVIFVDLGEFF